MSENNDGGARRRRRGGRSRGKGDGGRSNQPPKRPEIPDEFWGDVEAVPDTAGSVRITHAPSAVIESLGRPPLPGHEVPATHTFKLVYDYSVSLASALAAAGELIEPEELQD